MKEFENSAYYGIYKSRFVASWLKVGGQLRTGADIGNFRHWLMSLGLTEDEAQDIVYYATNGKLELQSSAKKFIEEHS